MEGVVLQRWYEKKSITPIVHSKLLVIAENGKAFFITITEEDTFEIACFLKDYKEVDVELVIKSKPEPL